MENQTSHETDTMTSSAPYYQSVHATEFRIPSLQAYDHSNVTEFQISQELAQQLAQQTHPFATAPHDDGNAGDDESDPHLRNIGIEQLENGAQLAGLLEAVNSATGREGASTEHGDTNPQSLRDVIPHDNFPPATLVNQLGKRKRTDSPGETVNDASKRAKQGHEPPSHINPFTTPETSSQPPAPTSTARAAGVHSAAALFRSPAASTAKKYTRPPMSKLYSSLRLSPEDFLHLQASAKSYMLDPAHPERQDCVGSRAKGDTDMVKLKLFNCVRDFLAEGAGERWFPDNSPVGGELGTVSGNGHENPERWIWPRDGNQIVSLVTPLMRRMVTNERQRMYAIETRKGGGTKKTKDDAVNGFSSEHQDGSAMQVDSSWPDQQHELDPSLTAPPLEQKSPTVVQDEGHPPTPPAAPFHNAPAQVEAALPTAAPPPPNCATNVLQFIFLRNQARLLRFDWPNPDRSPFHVHMTFTKLVHTIVEHVQGIRGVDDSAYHAGASVEDSTAVELATQKAKAAPVATNGSPTHRPDQHHDAVDPLHGAEDLGDNPTTDHPLNTASDEDHSERLRREIEIQMGHGSGQDPVNAANSQQPLDSVQLHPSFADFRITVKALTPTGLVSIEREGDWEDAKVGVANAPWLEGCLRVVVDML